MKAKNLKLSVRAMRQGWRGREGEGGGGGEGRGREGGGREGDRNVASKL